MLTAVLLGMVALAAAYVLLTWNRDYSSTPLPAITASRDPDIVARGEYLVNSVALCPFCHGDPARKPGEPLDWDVPLAGGHVWDIPMFGRFVAANITPDMDTGNMGRDGQGAVRFLHTASRSGDSVRRPGRQSERRARPLPRDRTCRAIRARASA